MKQNIGIGVEAHRRSILIAAALTAIACVYYLVLITDGDWNLLGAELDGLVFNDMLAHLLRGDVTASPAVTGQEAFLSKGHTVVYWGIFPAFLRLPLVPLHALYELQIARLSCWAAICILASVLVSTLMLVYRASAASSRTTLLFYILVVTTLFSGAVLTNSAIAYVYNEPIVWAAALSVAFNYLVLRRVISGARLRSRDLLALACLAGLTLNCRVLEGIGLCLAVAWILLLTVFAEAKDAPIRTGLGIVGKGLRKAIVPAVVLVIFVAICGMVNYLRWGSPLVFADLRHHIQISATPRRLDVLETYGEFNLVRIPFAIGYYFIGIPASELLERSFSSLKNLYDGIEVSVGGLVITDILALVLAVLGVRFLFRRPAGLRPLAGPLVAGVLVAELVGLSPLLAADFLAVRYRMDFVPAMSLAAAIGYFWLNTKTGLSNRLLRGAAVLAGIGIVVSHFSLVRYKEEVVPYKNEGRMFWMWYPCANNLKNCSH